VHDVCINADTPRRAVKQARSSDHRSAHASKESVMLLTVLFVFLLVVALGGGGWGYSRAGALSWSPAAIILVVGIILFATGNMHFR